MQACVPDVKSDGCVLQSLNAITERDPPKYRALLCTKIGVLGALGRRMYSTLYSGGNDNTGKSLRELVLAQELESTDASPCSRCWK